MKTNTESTTNTVSVNTSPTAHIKQDIHITPKVIASSLMFECMECGTTLDLDYLGGHLDMGGKEYHQLDACDCDGEWSERILMTIKWVKA